jgi:DNA-binding IclR family transcriptional regulator
MTEHTGIIEMLAKEPVDGIGVSDLAGRLKVSKATAYRRLQDLVEAGWCEQTPSGTYALSMKFGELAETVRKGYLAKADIITQRLGKLDAVTAPSAA